MFTPKGEEVRVLVLRISARRASGVGCVRAVSCEGVLVCSVHFGMEVLGTEMVVLCLGRRRWKRRMRVQHSRPIACRLGRRVLGRR